MSAFDAALTAMFGDPNLGVDVVYRPAAGSPVACRGAFAAPDIGMAPPLGKLKDTKRILLLKAADVAAPAKGDTLDVAAGTLKVIDFSANDPLRLTWRLELAGV